MTEKIKIGILGAGTVGSGVIQALENNPFVEIKKVGVRDKSKKRDFKLDSPILTEDLSEIINDDEIQIIVELLGGIDPAKEYVTSAIKNKKFIVTANKDLIATHGAELFDLANKNSVQIQFEASVCGAIPIINTMKKTLSANKFKKLIGILNGTTNYMLSEMLTRGLTYEHCLKEAQTKGYAEPDPTNDVSGKDMAYKLAILASIAFNKKINFDEVYHEGIERITTSDIAMAEEMGYRLKLIGLVQKDDDSDEVDLRVHPAFIKQTSTLASVFGANNGVLIDCDLANELTLIGPGAGAFPTASAVVGDINILAAQLSCSKTPNPLQSCNYSENAKVKPISETFNSYFLRVRTEDTPGVVGHLGTIFGKYSVSIQTLTQKGLNPDGSATITILTYDVKEKSILNAVAELEKIESIKQVDNVIRVLD